ncbi:MAG: DUF2142 domain-containing protein [Deltaproteobacteria bacterium]|nr:DUF2142 domain-containing protein [Deltaproteobacteria bacterium]
MEDTSLLQNLIRHKFFFFLCILFSCLYLYFFTNRAYVEVTIESPEPTLFKIYWAKDGQPYSEKNRTQLRVEPTQTKYGFFLTNLTDITKLRIDPHQHHGTSTIKKISIQQAGFKSLHFETIAEFSRLNPIFGIIEYGISKDGLFTKSLGNDPQFEFNFIPEKSTFNPYIEAIRIVALCLFLWLLYHYGAPLVRDLQYVQVFLAIIFILITLMATTSAENTHPDEYVHLDATRYYRNHWLPPHVDSPEIRHTYSVYGFSRLNTDEMSYLLTAKFSNLLTPFHLIEYQALRLFNILLFGIILLFVILRPVARPLALPFLLTPELWYTFSYCNSDAFAIFLYFITCCQVILPDSMLNNLLKKQFSNKYLLNYIFLAVLFSFLLLVKKNYHILMPFLLFFYLWKNWHISKKLKKESLLRLLIVVLAGLSLAGVRIACDYYVNGFDRAEKLAVLQEQTAKPTYKPSTELHKKHIYLYMKARGRSLEEIIKVDRWFGKTFRSSFGVYGYFTLSASDDYYKVVQWLGTAFLLFFICSIIMKGGLQNNILLFTGLGCGVSLIGISLWHSWTSDFQAQGRYLLPIILLLGIIYFHTQDIFQKRIFNFFVFSMFTVSLYSFIYIALLDIPKYISL